MTIRNKYCYNPITGERGTVVSELLHNALSEPIYCNVVWDDGSHSTEKAKNLSISGEDNINPPSWN